MFVATNVPALNSWLALRRTEAGLTQTIQQLSSGKRIHSAADDPAGLAISTQMQTQVLGMQQAYLDTQQGVSLLQTAGGALSRIQNVLQSMIAITTQAANDTNNQVDRAALQQQMDQYTSAIADITNQTAFNTKNLLDGVLGTPSVVTGPDPGQALAISLGAVDPVSLGIAASAAESAAFTSTAVPTGTLGNLSLFGAGDPVHPGGSRGLQGTNYTLDVTAANATLNGADISGASLTPTDSTATGTEGSVGPGWVVYTGGTTQQVLLQVKTGSAPGLIGGVRYSLDGGRTYQVAGTDSNGDYTLGQAGVTVLAGGITTNGTTGAVDTYSLNLTPATATLSLTDAAGTAVGPTTTVSGIALASQSLAVGGLASGQAVGVSFNSAALFGVTASDIELANGSAPGSGAMQNPFTVSYTGGSAASGLDGMLQSPALAPTGLSVMSYTDANSALGSLQNALTHVSRLNGRVGAYTNRLLAAASDLQTSQQNLRAARGRLVGQDIASGEARLSQQLVLQKSGVAAMALAEAVPRAILKLLP